MNAKFNDVCNESQWQYVHWKCSEHIVATVQALDFRHTITSFISAITHNNYTVVSLPMYYIISKLHSSWLYALFFLFFFLAIWVMMVTVSVRSIDVKRSQMSFFPCRFLHLSDWDDIFRLENALYVGKKSVVWMSLYCVLTEVSNGPNLQDEMYRIRIPINIKKFLFMLLNALCF